MKPVFHKPPWLNGSKPGVVPRCEGGHSRYTCASEVRHCREVAPSPDGLTKMEALLRDMKKRATSFLLFPSPFEPGKAADASAIRRRLRAACQTLELGHVTPHGLRSYFVTRARESGLRDAEISMLIGDKTGPAIIAHTYGDVRPDHLLKQAQRIRLTAAQPSGVSGKGSSIAGSNTSPGVSTCFTVSK